ncbi:helix-turn-helix domain-containing protein [Rhodococcus triatomae]|uniref:AraC-type DNA-binding protein n=1 Tax=Rhodococcus triatomae TaxID=300028 RepID=A0A1G8IA92_9NOCA|nr:helix-turn-helix domain-containing protein [Rhodococcus triatomae]QNG20997.1 helix-turn-helix domain-containing protein [Rhodococcus triatomae]QNG23088.1 helix-turn-helix domain-containing protein [Rhodococcus triatomae]SDI15681.1 AraC-type DNA-binding protein [Rhodococcus triatomae]
MSWYVPSTPAPDLSDTVVCGWTARSEGGEHLLVPDACVDVLWIRGVGLRVCGPETAAWAFVLPDGVESTGVRLRPGEAAHLFRTPTSEYRDVRVGLDELLGSPWDRRLTDRLDNAPGPRARTAIFEDAVREWRRHRPEPDPFARHVCGALAEWNWPVRDLAEHTSMTERRLQRRCNDVFGYSPATLRSILRLQRFMALARQARGSGLAEVAFLAGYSDQAHLTRDCRRITSLTPVSLLASAAPHWHGEGSVVAPSSTSERVA